MPLLVGLLLAAAALTPSLIPRDWALQGALAGICMAMGYVVTQFVLAIWRTLEIPVLPKRWASWAHIAIAIPVLIVFARCVVMANGWQNSIRLRMQIPALEGDNTVKILLLGVAVFLGLFFLGCCIQALFNLLRRRLARYIPVFSANVLGLLLASLIIVMLTRDAVVDTAFRIADTSLAAAQNLRDPDAPPPSETWQAGGPGSFVDWSLMGTPGRNYVLGGPRAAAITRFSGQPARDPLRIYVGLAQEADPKARADIALREALRVGAFDRKILVIAMPTGTGWMDPASYGGLEYMHGGDVATIAVQYSYLQSPLALIFEPDTGPAQASEIIRAIYDHWRLMPAATRPRLYLHGISLGAWSSMQSFNPLQMIGDPPAGAFWVGPPFPSGLWNQTNASRQPGSPLILPRIDDDSIIRYASQFAPPGRIDAPWGRVRIVFLQHASDAIVFFDPTSLWREPLWMRQPRGADVSPYLSFTPIVTQLQLLVDMLVATSTPSGFGHIYAASEYIDGWVAVTAPEGWSDEMTTRLKAICGQDGHIGCAND